MTGQQVDELAHVGNARHVFQDGGAPSAPVPAARERQGTERAGFHDGFDRPPRQNGDAKPGLDVYDETSRRSAKAFDRKGLVLFCGSFSKVLAPGLRVGWVEAGRFRDRVEALKSITSMMTAALPQLAVAELLESGFYDRYIKRLRIRVADQTSRYIQALSAAFPSGTRMTRPAGGNLVWVQLPNGGDGSLLYRRAQEQGIGIFPGEIFSARGKHREFVRVSCGAPWSPAVERAVAALGHLSCERAR